MNNIGVVEGFFGPEWSPQARLDYADFLTKENAGFYIYAPKRDPKLRKHWRDDWDKEYLKILSELARYYQKRKLKFGVALSPFGLGHRLSESDKKILVQKVRSLSDIGVDILGLFFDDMPVIDALAATQIQVAKMVHAEFKGQILFCPSFYSDDPILDKVFGQRPPHYVEDIGLGIPKGISVLWTGPKVISDSISIDHLDSVTTILKRPPFLWENLYANDGPRNCQFLKLKTFAGRESGFEGKIESIAFNLMNQPYLSQILFSSSALVINKKMHPDAALDFAMKSHLPNKEYEFLTENREVFLNEGLLKMGDDKKESLLKKLKGLNGPVMQEVSNWLCGGYVVGPECLTD